MQRREQVQQRLLELTGIDKADAEATGILTMQASAMAVKAEKAELQPKKLLHWDYVLKEAVGFEPVFPLSPCTPNRRT